ncbi:hypothetical protein LTR94_038778, partial [Friedmanniomyces endolithicus]
TAAPSSPAMSPKPAKARSSPSSRTAPKAPPPRPARRSRCCWTRPPSTAKAAVRRATRAPS